MYRIDSIVLAKCIDKACKEFNIPKSDFHLESGISSATLSQWRKGQDVSPESVQKVESYFKMGVEDLIGKFHGTTREDLFDNPRMRLLFDVAKDATDADLLEAAALLERRKEERNK